MVQRNVLQYRVVQCSVVFRKCFHNNLYIPRPSWKPTGICYSAVRASVVLNKVTSKTAVSVVDKLN